jgi:hypothetical protein
MNAPDWRASAIFLSALGLAAFCTAGENSALMASRVAWITFLGLAATSARELSTRPPREWFRIDLAALAAAFYLTLAEFLPPQPQFAKEVSAEAASRALRLVLLGLAGLAVGRHLVRFRPNSDSPPWPNPNLKAWVALLFLCLAIANLHLFLSVGFNPVTLIQELLGPRFSQPWSRDRLGDSRALLSELQLLNYLIPPLTAWLIAQCKTSTWKRVSLTLPFLFLLTISFCSGTRYVVATHAAAFAVALAWSLPNLSPRRAALLFVVPLSLLLLVTVVALRFRHNGLSRTLTQPQSATTGIPAPQRFIVDNNLRTIARLTETFPHKHPYLGLEIPWHMAVRPLPRVFFPHKPEKLSLSMEEIIGIPRTTIAASFVGEGFLMAGAVGTLLFGLGLGSLCSLWNRIPVGSGSSYAVILYASGIGWIFLGLRSPIWISVGFLPCLALWLIVRIAFPVAGRLLRAQGEREHGPPRL